MTPEVLADLHHRGMEVPRAWTAEEFSQLLLQERTFLCADNAGFALGSVVADEAELLTIVIEPERRRHGHGSRLLALFEGEAIARGARHGFLEVAEPNTAARALYSRTGWTEVGRRPAYYAACTGSRIDALILKRAFVR